MVAEAEKRGRHAVTCLFCGAPTLLSPAHEQQLLSAASDKQPKSTVVLIRCHLCLKEAPYRREQVEKLAVAVAAA